MKITFGVCCIIVMSIAYLVKDVVTNNVGSKSAYELSRIMWNVPENSQRIVRGVLADVGTGAGYSELNYATYPRYSVGKNSYYYRGNGGYHRHHRKFCGIQSAIIV